MFGFANDDGPKPKCLFTSTVLPAYVDHEQLPSKKRPFSTVLGQIFNHSLDVVLQQDDSKALLESLHNGGKLQYCKVYMKLSDLIEGEFFNQYIKTGNIFMLSEGRARIDHVFSLSEGILRLEVDKPTYERMGLKGKAIPSQGRKHVKARYAIEINLRLPSMVRGEKEFERVIWAFKNVLNKCLAWLFYDLKGPTDGAGPIAPFQPKVRGVEPDVQISSGVSVPCIPSDIDQENFAKATELLEWLSLVTSGSPRTQERDEIDPFLNRYQVPTDGNGSDDADHQIRPAVQNLVRLHWHGLMHPEFILKVLQSTLKACGDNWFAMSASAFDGNVYTFLQNKRHTLTWEYQD